MIRTREDAPARRLFRAGEGYWFYSYLTWCYPLLIIAIVQDAKTPRGSAAMTYSRTRVSRELPRPGCRSG